MNLRYFGHSAFEINVRGARILLDPFITGNPFAESVVAPADLRPDFILVTHAHGDHWGDTLEIAKRSDATVVGNFEIVQYAQHHGVEKARSMNTGGSSSFAWGTLTQTYASHSSSFPDGTYGGNPNGYIIEADEKCVYALGDTAPFAEMEWIGQDYDVDVALVPIGDCFTMGPRDSLRAMKLIRPTVTIPVHYNTFPQIEVDVREWKETVAQVGFAPRVLEPGDVYEL